MGGLINIALNCKIAFLCKMERMIYDISYNFQILYARI